MNLTLINYEVKEPNLVTKDNVLIREVVDSKFKREISCEY